jgi:transposase InsO family protein
MQISRANLINREIKGKQMNSIKKTTTTRDQDYIGKIKDIIDERPSYGYRRVTAILNRDHQGNNINHKKVYRLMRENDLLLHRYGKRPRRTHDGKVTTLNSNMRWCSDCFGIRCDNGDTVYVAFSMDCCDRETMRHIASSKGINGEMIRDLMIESVEYRFGNIDKLPHKIQWLSDNGPCYTSYDTVNFGRGLGFEICTTPPYSPESNGMAESFVKTFKRDYVWFGDLSDAKTVMEQLDGWFADYNNFAPHKGLKMLAPREFMRHNQKK